MRIKSILVEMEDGSGEINKVLFSDFNEIVGNDVEIHTETNSHMRLRHNGKLYPYTRVNNKHNIIISLRCSDYTLTKNERRLK